jgi:hypothetical protein
MDMSYSYKPVLLCADDKGRVKLDDIVSFFRAYYEGRRSAGLVVEKKNSIFARGDYTGKEVARKSCPIHSSDLRTCRCCATPKHWVLSRSMRLYGNGSVKRRRLRSTKYVMKN